MIRELSRAIERSGREGCGDLEAQGIWEGLGWGVRGKPLALYMGFPCSSASLSPSPQHLLSNSPQS